MFFFLLLLSFGSAKTTTYDQCVTAPTPSTFALSALNLIKDILEVTVEVVSDIYEVPVVGSIFDKVLDLIFNGDTSQSPANLSAQYSCMASMIINKTLNQEFQMQMSASILQIQSQWNIYKSDTVTEVKLTNLQQLVTLCNQPMSYYQSYLENSSTVAMAAILPYYATISLLHLGALQQQALVGPYLINPNQNPLDPDQCAQVNTWNNDLVNTYTNYTKHVDIIFQNWITWRKQQFTISPSECYKRGLFFCWLWTWNVQDLSTGISYTCTGDKIEQPTCVTGWPAGIISNETQLVLGLLEPVFYLHRFVPWLKDSWNMPVLPSWASGVFNLGPFPAYPTGINDINTFKYDPPGVITSVYGGLTSLTACDREAHLVINMLQFNYLTGAGISQNFGMIEPRSSSFFTLPVSSGTYVTSLAGCYCYNDGNKEEYNPPLDSLLLGFNTSTISSTGGSSCTAGLFNISTPSASWAIVSWGTDNTYESVIAIQYAIFPAVDAIIKGVPYQNPVLNLVPPQNQLCPLTTLSTEL